MKKLIIIVGILVVVVIGVLVFGISKLGPIIQTAVNTYGPEITKTQVSLGGVNVSLFSGRASLSDLFLGNPRGFDSPQAIRVRSVLVDVDEKSLAGDTIVIDNIEIKGPEITYEKKIKTDNFQAILKNIKEATGQDRASGKTQAKTEVKAGNKDGGKNILIRNFLLEGGSVTLTESVLEGRTFMVPLRDIHLTNVGNNGMGAPPAEVVAEILAVIYGEITSPAMAEALSRELKKLGAHMEADLRKRVDKETQKQIEKAGEDLKKELEASGVDVKDVGRMQDQLNNMLGK